MTAPLWQSKMREWDKSPSLFVREALGVEPQEWQDTEVLKPIEQGKRRIAIRSGHGVGKTAVECWVVLWFLLFRRPCKIPVTANSQDQLRNVIWAELSKWHQKLPSFLRDLIEVEVERAYVKANPNNAFAVAVTARQERPEALQGFQSDNLLFVMDEASGIPDPVFEVAGGALTGPNSLVIMAGNPTRLSGYFYRAFHESRAFWHCAHVPCSRSSRDNQAYIAERNAEYGENSNVVRVRVNGDFPTSEAASVIPLDTIEAAKGRKVGKTPLHPIWGLDVARKGDDDSALVIREGNYLIGAPHIWHGLELSSLAGRIIDLYNETPKHMRPEAICIDSIGLGAGVISHLTDRNSPVADIVRGINVAESSSSDDRYARLRDQLWFKGREWFAAKDCCLPSKGVPDGPNDVDGERAVERLIGELSRPTFDYTAAGKLKVQSKDEMKRAGMKSPDVADAFLLTFAVTPVTRPEVRDAHRRDRHRYWEPAPDPWSI